MHPYPHFYSVDASGRSAGDVVVATEGVPHLHTAPPAQFDGPGDRWSPETLLVGAVADCFVLTFRAVARASNLAWSSLHCGAKGRLERADGKTRFTGIELHAELTVPAETSAAKARHLLEKTEKACLISSSLAFAPTLTCNVIEEREDVIIGEPDDAIAVGGP